jgi:peptidoglycan/LPS O-acetylase OafA/YrhL
LDGIRGIAILAVVFYHATERLEGAWRTAGSWGWMGVDLFFVLSGFLITGILLDARESPSRLYYGGFYARRALRILPAFVVLMIALLNAPGFTGLSLDDYARVADHQLWYWAFLGNALVAIGGWAAVVPQTGPLWSLAVEEQFYLIWPSVVRRLTARGILRLGLLIVVTVGVGRTILVRRGVNFTIIGVSMPTRADLLAWGAVLAALMRLPNGGRIVRRGLWPAFACGIIGLTAVIVRLGDARPTSPSMIVVGFPAIALLSTAAVAMAIIHDVPPLHFAWLRGFGRISYGLYLWHMTAIAVFVQLFSVANAWSIPLVLLLALVPTLLSWFLIEQPSLSLKKFAPMGLNRSVGGPGHSSANTSGTSAGSTPIRTN